MASALDLWRLRTVNARVTVAEDDGPRRTFLLFENGVQTGHVRGREILGDARRGGYEPAWRWEAAGSGRALIPADDAQAMDERRAEITGGASAARPLDPQLTSADINATANLARILGESDESEGDPT